MGIIVCAFSRNRSRHYLFISSLQNYDTVVPTLRFGQHSCNSLLPVLLTRATTAIAPTARSMLSRCKACDSTISVKSMLTLQWPQLTSVAASLICAATHPDHRSHRRQHALCISPAATSVPTLRGILESSVASIPVLNNGSGAGTCANISREQVRHVIPCTCSGDGVRVTRLVAFVRLRRWQTTTGRVLARASAVVVVSLHCIAAVAT